MMTAVGGGGGGRIVSFITVLLPVCRRMHSQTVQTRGLISIYLRAVIALGRNLWLVPSLVEDGVSALLALLVLPHGHLSL